MLNHEKMYAWYVMALERNEIALSTLLKSGRRDTFRCFERNTDIMELSHP